MLVLSRRLGEIVRARVPHPDGTYTDLVVKVVDLDRAGMVRLGFDCPRDVIIHRQEIWDALADSKPEEKT